MKQYNKLIIIVLLISHLFAKDEQLNINFQNLSIMDLITITSKAMNKNILLTETIEGNVDFISNKATTKDNIVDILVFALESKGYTLVENQNILRVVKLEESSKYSPPLLANNERDKYSRLVTEVIRINNSNADQIGGKIRHLLSKNGKLVTDKDTNILLITDFITNINTIKQAIDVISKEQNNTLRVVSINNIDVNAAQTELNTISNSIYKTPNKANIIVNNSTKTITIIGEEEQVKYLEEYLINLDKQGINNKKVVRVVDLKNSSAENLIKVVEGILKEKTYENINQKPHVSVDTESNSIVLIGPNSEISYLLDLINALDKEKLQVYVHAKIIEVSEIRSRNIGLKYGLAASKTTSSSIFNLGANLGGSINAIGTSDIFDIAKPVLKSGIALGATLNFLKTNEVIDIVSEPSILCINNKESSIYVGETRSFQVSSLSTTSNPEASNVSFERENIGLTLKVKPRISSKNKVTLEMQTILEDAKALRENQINPDTTKKEIKTSAIVMNGESVILGGLIRNRVNNINDDVPFFSSIPILGNLFKNDFDVDDQVNLVIIVTPYIIPESKDLTYIRDQLTKLKSLEEKYTEVLVKEIENIENIEPKQIDKKEDKLNHQEVLNKMYGNE